MSVSLKPGALIKPGTLVDKLLKDYAAFQRSRPDLPQGEIDTLSQRDLQKLIDAYELARARPQLEELSGDARLKFEKLILRSASGKSVTLRKVAKYTGK
jgi:hypothetical protein